MKIINEYHNEKEILSQSLKSELDWTLIGCNRNSEEIVHKILDNILNTHKNGKVGVLHGFEGGLTIDYIHIETQEEWRFVMGFTELGY